MYENKKSVLLVAARFSNNLGDDIIYDIVADVCKKERGKDPIGLSISGRQTFVSVDTSSAIKSNTLIRVFKSTFLYSIYVKYKGALNVKRMLNSLNENEFDTIVFAGGQLFMDYFVTWIDEIVRYAEQKDKKVVFNCCGMGQLSDKSVRVLGKVLRSKSIYSVTLRDGQEYFENTFGISGALRTLDPAIDSMAFYGYRETKGKKIGVGLISYEMLKKKKIQISEESYMKLVASLIEYLENKNRQIVVFTNGDVADQEFAMKTLQLIHREYLLENRPIRPINLVDIVSRCEYIISFRLHSLILATSYNIPSIGFAWDSKVEEFFKETGREEWVISMTQEVKLEAVLSLVDELLTTDLYEVKIDLPSSCNYLKKCLKEIEG